MNNDQEQNRGEFAPKLFDKGLLPMIEQKKDAPGNPPYYVCTNCKWAFQALQEANEHGRRCGRKEPAPAYRHYEGFIK